MRRTPHLLVLASLALAAPTAPRADAAPAPTTPAPSASTDPTTTGQKAPSPRRLSWTPYGFVLVQAFFDDGPFAAKDYPGQVLANGDGGAFLMSARGTRLGVKVGFPDDPWTGARLDAVVEADFKAGSLPSSYATTCTTPAGGGNPTCTTSASAPSTAWYNGLLRVRLAYAQAAWDLGRDQRLTLIAGQDWRVVSPLAPTSLAYGYDQLFTAAGNLNQRDPQLKAIYDGRAGAVGWTVTAAVLSPQDAFLGAPGGGVDYGAGNRSRVPNVEGRVAASYRPGGKTVAEVGLAGLVGNRRYNPAGAPLTTFDTTVRLAALDGRVRLPYVTLQGEAFASDGAEDALLGLVSAAVLGPSVSGSFLHLQSEGAWIQAVLEPIPAIQIPVGYGFEQLRFRDAGLPATTRTRNAQLHAGVLLNVKNPWKFGFEWVRTTSGYGLSTPAPQSLQADQFVVATRLDL